MRQPTCCWRERLDSSPFLLQCVRRSRRNMHLPRAIRFLSTLPLVRSSLAHAIHLGNIACRQPPLTSDRRSCSAPTAARTERAGCSWMIDTDRFPGASLFLSLPLFHLVIVSHWRISRTKQSFRRYLPSWQETRSSLLHDRPSTERPNH